MRTFVRAVHVMSKHCAWKTARKSQLHLRSQSRVASFIHTAMFLATWQSASMIETRRLWSPVHPRLSPSPDANLQTPDSFLTSALGTWLRRFSFFAFHAKLQKSPKFSNISPQIKNLQGTWPQTRNHVFQTFCFAVSEVRKMALACFLIKITVASSSEKLQQKLHFNSFLTSKCANNFSTLENRDSKSILRHSSLNMILPMQ